MSENTNCLKMELTKKVKKRKFPILTASILSLLIFTLICGFFYPLVTTATAQLLFPYEANGSQIVVKLKDGSERIYGSEFIGQNYENPKFLFGRVNNEAPTNLSPESDEYKKLLEKRIDERKEKLASIGYTDLENIPAELITSSGSGVDPHISPEAAYFQIPVIVKARQDSDITSSDVKDIIDKYTEGRFLFIFGEKRVNVLLVNLALEGLI